MKEYDFNKKMNTKNSPYMKLSKNELFEYFPQFILSIWYLIAKACNSQFPERIQVKQSLW